MKKAIIGVDLSFGDSGKGTTTDFLVREYNAKTVVRYCGGPQAAHNVIDLDGVHHTFAQFGSGTLVSGTKTYLSRFMLIDPLNMENEERFLQRVGITDAFDRMFIDEDCIVITPFQKSVNRLRELNRGEGRHGSCGRGVGETVSDSINYPEYAIYAKDFLSAGVLKKKLTEIQRIKVEEIRPIIEEIPASDIKDKEWEILTDETLVDYLLERYMHFQRIVNFVPRTFLAEILEEEDVVIFEGSQGVLLDEWHGFHPYTTWSTTTTKYAEQLLKEAEYKSQVVKIGILRALTTRHGPGPFPTFDESLSQQFPDVFNVTDEWQREFRVGYFDSVLHSYALDVVGGVDALMITHMDLVGELGNLKICRAYQVSEENQKEAYQLGCIIESGFIISLPTFEKDLKMQSRLTELLLRVHPVYHLVSPEDFLKSISSLLETPIGMVSFGPRSDQKMLLGVETAV